MSLLLVVVLILCKRMSLSCLGFGLSLVFSVLALYDFCLTLFMSSSCLLLFSANACFSCLLPEPVKTIRRLQR